MGTNNSEKNGSIPSTSEANINLADTTWILVKKYNIHPSPIITIKVRWVV